MLTQCPHCHTLFRIRDEQLLAADGQARCCRCNQVFNALAHLKNEGSKSQRRSASGLRASYPSRNSPPGSHRPEIPQRPRVPRLDPGPAIVGAVLEEPARTLVEHAKAGLDDEASAAPIDGTSPSLPLVESRGDTEPVFAVASGAGLDAADQDTEPTFSQPVVAEREPFPFEVADDLPEIEPTEAEAAHWSDETDTSERPSLWSQLGWGLGALLLVCTALVQVLWWDRDAFAQTVQGRRVVEPFCAAIGCEVAPRKALDRIRVLSRDVSPHPTQSQALLIMLVMANEASFAQPFPLLQLTLYDDQERAVGQRRFTPQEYLGEARVRQMKPDQAVYVRLELVDPGKAVTGFRFDFL